MFGNRETEGRLRPRRRSAAITTPGISALERASLIIRNISRTTLCNWDDIRIFQGQRDNMPKSGAAAVSGGRGRFEELWNYLRHADASRIVRLMTLQAAFELCARHPALKPSLLGMLKCARVAPRLAAGASQKTGALV